MYIQKAELNGKRLENCWLYQKDFAGGGSLELWLGPEPNKDWGKSPIPSTSGSGDKRWRSSLKSKPGEQAADAVHACGNKDVSPMFRRMDVNADCKVTRQEFLRLWTEAFRNQDKDGDGMLNEIEFGHPVSFKHADADQDGKATLAEFTKMYSNQFKGLDRNKDSLLTIDEV